MTSRKSWGSLLKQKHIQQQLLVLLAGFYFEGVWPLSKKHVQQPFVVVVAVY